jgi:hypothetical protein
MTFDAMLQPGRSRVRVPKRSLIFFSIDVAALGPGVDSASSRNEYQKQKNVSGGVAGE